MTSRFLRTAAFATLLTLVPTHLSWAIDPPLRKLSGLDRPVQETMVKVKTARVILADYELLKRDFPELKNRSNQEIDHWLLEQTAFVSRPQAAQEVVNTRIAVGSETRTAYRPERYGRAAVFQTGREGLIDVKGVGALVPRHGDYGDGLASLGESIREYAFEKLVKRVLDHSGSGIDTVGSYAVIDMGFDVVHPDGARSPAGLILRQAHERATGKYALRMDQDVALRIEKVLRRYGITSAGMLPQQFNPRYEYINVQGTKDNKALVDFGAYIVVDHFKKPAMDLDSFADGTRKVTLAPNSSSWVRPDPSIQVPSAQWGHSVTGKADPRFDNPWVWSHELAAHLRDGTASRADAEQHLRNLLGPVEQRLSAHPARIPVGSKDSETVRCILNELTSLKNGASSRD